MATCVFCHQECNGESETGTICSNCVQVLLFTDPTELQHIYKIAVEKNPVKAKSLLNFVGFTITGKTLQRRRKVNTPIRRKRCQRITNRLQGC